MCKIKSKAIEFCIFIMMVFFIAEYSKDFKSSEVEYSSFRVNLLSRVYDSEPVCSKTNSF